MVGVICAVFITGFGSALVYYDYQRFNHDYLHLGKETVNVYINNNLVSHTENVIQNPTAYQAVFCKLFNDSTACNLGVSGVIPPFAGTGCNTYTGGGYASGVINSHSNCAYDGIVLSNLVAPNPSPSTVACVSPVNSNGVTPIKATTFNPINGGGLGQNQIMLTASWTATGSGVQGITQACLIAWDDITNSPVSQTTGAGGSYWWPLAITVLNGAPYSVIGGQTIAVSWTFSF